VPEWKWEEIAMDFVVGLPRTQSSYDSIWVIMDRLTKVAHFIPVKTTYSGLQLAKLYMSRIVKDRRRQPEGVNGSQSKFFDGTWHISQIEPDAPLF
jgi:hypothetical protein